MRNIIRILFAAALFAPACVTTVPRCKDIADVDQSKMEAAGYVLQGVEEGSILETPAVAGLFTHPDGRAEVHLMAEADLAEFLGNHGWNRRDMECTTRAGKDAEIITRAYAVPVPQTPPI